MSISYHKIKSSDSEKIAPSQSFFASSYRGAFPKPNFLKDGVTFGAVIMAAREESQFSRKKRPVKMGTSPGGCSSCSESSEIQEQACIPTRKLVIAGRGVYFVLLKSLFRYVSEANKKKVKTHRRGSLGQNIDETVNQTGRSLDYSYLRKSAVTV